MSSINLDPQPSGSNQDSEERNQVIQYLLFGDIKLFGTTITLRQKDIPFIYENGTMLGLTKIEDFFKGNRFLTFLRNSAASLKSQHTC